LESEGDGPTQLELALGQMTVGLEGEQTDSESALISATLKHRVLPLVAYLRLLT
jgi:hypothetical protein